MCSIMRTNRLPSSTWYFCSALVCLMLIIQTPRPMPAVVGGAEQTPANAAIMVPTGRLVQVFSLN